MKDVLYFSREDIDAATKHIKDEDDRVKIARSVKAWVDANHAGASFIDHRNFVYEAVRDGGSTPFEFYKLRQHQITGVES